MPIYITRIIQLQNSGNNQVILFENVAQMATLA